MAASADEDLVESNVVERQMKLGQMLLVGARMYGRIGDIKELPLKILEQYKEETRK